ncbi:MAG: hypothetical protein HYY90_05410 [Candidatus Omnitrophica bacterium]|nr:hypothetical protein [Candidatus Omnitrophota bacterium]MBI3020832.1 hypothetical protein [Candidatus Omnitrophota bacterium]MBI3083781.1 hypothetical protein [Candidatus Omnitrophota bacterium]
MRVVVLDAWQALYEGNAGEVLLPGEDGELCVLDFHQPFLSRLRAGAIQILAGRKRPPGARAMSPALAEARILIQDGIARMTGNELVILVQT